MKKRLALGVAGLAVAVTAVIVVVRLQDAGPTPPQPVARTSGLDPLVEEFRSVERACIQRFNTALREQRENMIDELELSNAIERDVLTPWRALRTKVTAAPAQNELYSTLRRYLEERQLSWEAYVSALRAASDEAAKPHYETHRRMNAAAHESAKILGELFRAAAGP